MFYTICIAVLIGLLYLGYNIFKLFKVPKHLEEFESPSLAKFLLQLLILKPYDVKSKLFYPILQRNGVIRIWTKGKWQLSASDSDLILHMLKNVNEFPKMLFLESVPDSLLTKFIGNNLIFSNGESWKRQRAIINACFKKSWDLAIFKDCATDLLDRFDGQQGKNVKVNRWMQRVTIEAITRALMGMHLDAVRRDDVEFIDLYNRVIGACFNPIYILFPFLDTAWNPLRYPAIQDLHKLNIMFDDLIDDRIAKIENGDLIDNDRDVLTQMVQSHLNDPDGLTKDEIRFNSIMFFVAGHDTTSFAMCVVLHFLAQNPDLQKEVRKEILECLGDDENIVPTHEQMGRLNLVNSIIKESLRLYPSVASIPGRVTTQSFQFQNYTIPADVEVELDIFNLHRNPKYFKDPETFDPYRFLDSNKAQEPHFYSFGGGSRLCLGISFSMLEQKMVISYLCRRYFIKYSNPELATQPLKVGTFGVLSAPDFTLDFINWEKVE